MIASTVEKSAHPTRPGTACRWVPPCRMPGWKSRRARSLGAVGTSPVALMGVFVVLVVVATPMLRRQMRSVSLAEEAWRTEAAWRQAMKIPPSAFGPAIWMGAWSMSKGHGRHGGLFA